VDRSTFRVVLSTALAAAAVALLVAPAAAQLDPDTIWPLCGRITENPPPGWQPGDGCPLARAGDPAYSDAPFSSSFGPRPLASEGNRYDFHRGVDIATPIGTPIFAITEGVVQTAGVHPDYDDPVIRLRHFRPGTSSCSTVGCYNSLYLHVSGWVVSAGESVVKGQLIGYTGASGVTGFEHLHFEIRDAPGWDPFSSWSRDAVHPFRAVPYLAPNNSTITFESVDTTDPDATSAALRVVSNRFDFVSLALVARDAQGAEIPQPGATPDAHGYDVLPPFFDFESSNFQYSHKNSSAVPWSSFEEGGAYECPYRSEHGGGYDAAVHVDRNDPLDDHAGLFNGIRTTTLKYWPSDVRNYEVGIELLALLGPVACLEATATFASGDTAEASWGDCDGTPPPPPPAIELTAKANRRGSRVQLAWSGASGNRVDVHRDGALLTTTRNDGDWTDRSVSKGSSYLYRICEEGSTTACSPEVSIDL